MKRPGFDRRTKAFRQASAAKAVELPASSAVAGQAQAVLTVLAVLAGYSSDVRREILARAGMLA